MIQWEYHTVSLAYSGLAATRYRQRAEEVRQIASDMGHKECREQLLQVAKDYEKMAAQLERMTPPARSNR